MTQRTALSRRSHTAHRVAHSRRAILRRQIRATKPVHIRFALHPLSLFMLLITGVLIAGWTMHSAADSYTVTAKVPAPPLTEGAIITSPADGLTTATATVIVSGSCPDSSYVTLTRNGLFSGTSACAIDHTFTISTSLAEGANLLVAQDYNITDDPGPTTSSITVHYVPPAPPPSGGGSTGSGSGTSANGGSSSVATVQPLLLISDYRFKAVSTTDSFSWSVTINGGRAPYTMDIDWGDGGQSIQTFARAQTATLHHDYTNPGYFTIIVNLSDAVGDSTTLQLLAFIREPGGGILFTAGSPSSAPPVGNVLLAALTSSRWLLVAWPSYAVVSLMVASFWLGEHQEIRKLLHKPHRRLAAQHH